MLLSDHQEWVFPPLDDPEALMREARRRTRRRRAIYCLVLVVVLGCVAAAGSLLATGDNPAAVAQTRKSAGTLPVGRFVALAVAGPIAVGADGALYVADLARHRVLVRLPNGRFRVIAGDGRDGFSGDGGPASSAKLSTITDIALSPAGDLYIADGGRIRVVQRTGIIRTVAGDGKPLPATRRGPVAAIRAGTPALSAALGSPQAASYEQPMITFSPGGQLYISTGVQVLRLNPGGTLSPILALVTTPKVLRGPLRDFGPLAIDRDGNIDVAGFNGWSIWQITPTGVAHEIGRGSGARRSGGDLSLLQRAPNGHVYGENGPQLLQLDGRQLKPVHNFGDSFWLTYFAFGPHNSVYADEIPGGGGFEARQKLITIQHGVASQDCCK